MKNVITHSIAALCFVGLTAMAVPADAQQQSPGTTSPATTPQTQPQTPGAEPTMQQPTPQQPTPQQPDPQPQTQQPTTQQPRTPVPPPEPDDEDVEEQEQAEPADVQTTPDRTRTQTGTVGTSGRMDDQDAGAARTLPQTASLQPLIALLGLGSLAAFTALRRRR